jgi:glycosyltransferase involved in cell wall biosynthesis
MKIGYFTSIEEWGGSETYLLNIMQGVRERGHEVVIYGIERSRLLAEADKLQVKTVAWQTATRGLSHERHDASKEITKPQGPESESTPFLKRAILRTMPRWSRLLVGNYREMRHLRTIFSEHPVDLMHVSNSGYEVAGLACRHLGIPTLGMNMITPPRESWWLRRYLTRKLQWSFNHIWSSADPEKYTPPKHERRRNATDFFRLVSLGRLHPMKGYRYLIEALGQLQDPRIRLTIFGEGSKRANLEALVREYHLDEFVLMPGYTEHPALELQKADCFVLPSVSHESCPAVLAEAMASGLPLITSDFGPLAEVNVHQETGLVVPMHSVRELAESIRQLADSSELSVKLGKAGRMRFEMLFSRDAMIEKTLAIYDKILLHT